LGRYLKGHRQQVGPHFGTDENESKSGAIPVYLFLPRPLNGRSHRMFTSFLYYV
jgi:hypothetical protein